MEEKETPTEIHSDVVSVKEPEEKPSTWYRLTHIGLI